MHCEMEARFTRLRRKPRLPVLRSSLLRRMDKAVGLHPGTQHQRHFECEESPYESVSIREGSGLGYDATQSLLLCQV